MQLQFLNTYTLDWSSGSPRRHCEDGLARTVTRLMLDMPLRACRSPIGRETLVAVIGEPAAATVAGATAAVATGAELDAGCVIGVDALAATAAQRGTMSSCIWFNCARSSGIVSCTLSEAALPTEFGTRKHQQRIQLSRRQICEKI